MDRALLKLISLQWRAVFRRVGGRVTTLRGALFVAVGVICGCLSVAGALLFAFTPRQVDPERIRVMAGPALFAFWFLRGLAATADPAIAFSPAEIHLLFAGPFRRRALIVYKLVQSAPGILLFAGLMSLFVRPFVPWWAAAVVGLGLALLFVQLLTMSLALALQRAAERAGAHAGRLLLVALGFLLLLLFSRTLATETVKAPEDLVRVFRASPVMSAVLAPFDVFARVITAETLAGLVTGAALALAINVALLLLVLRLDAGAGEAALAMSQRAAARRQRMRRGGWGAPARASVWWRLPPFPWLGGAGPIAWRQLTTALRSHRAFLALVLPVAIPALVAVGWEGAREFVARALVGFVVAQGITTSLAVPFDFRGDVDHVVWLKMLPLTAGAIAAGELVAPVLVTSGLQVVQLACLSFLHEGARGWLVLAAFFALPVNLVLFGVDNLLFLLFPARMAPATAGDFQHFGRTMLALLAKVLVAGACLGVAAGLGKLTVWALGSTAAGWVVAWIVVVGLAVAIVPVVAWAYRRFDVSLDTPP